MVSPHAKRQAVRYLVAEQFSVRSHHQRPITPDEHLAGVDFYAYVVYRSVVGSRAYGLDHDESDTDLRGIYLPPADLVQARRTTLWQCGQ